LYSRFIKFISPGLRSSSPLKTGLGVGCNYIEASLGKTSRHPRQSFRDSLPQPDVRTQKQTLVASMVAGPKMTLTHMALSKHSTIGHPKNWWWIITLSIL
jgi:hypothetical protein